MKCQLLCSIPIQALRLKLHVPDNVNSENCTHKKKEFSHKYPVFHGTCLAVAFSLRLCLIEIKHVWYSIFFSLIFCLLLILLLLLLFLMFSSSEVLKGFTWWFLSNSYICNGLMFDFLFVCNYPAL